ncbi:MAG: flagellar basal body P-ring formation protein FlgA [Caulobacterales bacterium]|nr:flagellar basal body P-ring formation protein FlgA [Caulobacterales bacterium]MCA0372805.1 flagellar basal body P-ring formation chaperone FlgA [Pseudomonadota bacterium]
MNWHISREKFGPLIWFILAGFLAFAQINSARADGLILRENPVASGSHILIGDVFDNAGNAANKPLAIAPNANQKTVFNTDALRARLGSYGLKWQAPNNLKSIEVYGSENTLSSSMPISSNNKSNGDIPVLNRDVRRDEAITYDMISYIEANNYSNNVISDPARLIGARAKNAIKANTPIKNNEIGDALMVKKGGNVLLVHQIGGLKITLQAKSLDDGSTGSKIRVVNVQSNKIFDAIVDGDGIAHSLGINNQTLAAR